MKRRIMVAILGIALLSAGTAQAQFGGTVAVMGNDVIVTEGGGRVPGTLHVYRKGANGAWAERTKLTASNGRPGDGFGGRLVVDGDLLMVGALGADSGRGGAYVLRRDARAMTYTEVGRLGAATRQGDAFGNSVGGSGGVIAVGAPGRDSARGAVYLFREQGGSYVAAGELTAPERMVNARYGASLAMKGSMLVVGSSGYDRGTGRAYVYRPDASGNFQLETQLTVEGLVPNSRLGGPITIRDSFVLLSASGVDANAGAIYAFKRDTAGAWANVMALRPFDSQRGLIFGQSVTFLGNDMLVGAVGADRNTGTVYRFASGTGGGYRGAERLNGQGVERAERFATHIAAGGSILAVGVAGDDFGMGAAMIYEDRAGSLRQAARLTLPDAGLAAVTGTERQCEGRAAQFACNNVDLLSFLPIRDIGGVRGVRLNDIWGWTDPTTNREYALVGRINGTSFVDVTNPTRPIYLGDLPMTTGAQANAWRDIKTYRDHAFIVADGAGQHGMQVFDLSQLRNIRPGAPRTFEPLTTYSRFGSAHNIVINEQSGYAYAVGANSGGETCGGGLHMIDIRTPQQPAFAGCFQDTTTGMQKTGYSHDAQCVMYRGPDTRYAGREICLGSNETAISIADVTDKAHPVPISTISYPSVSYAHQGWLTDDQRYFYLDDEGDEMSGKVPGTRTMIFDLSDLRDPVVAGEYISPNRAIDHNLYVRGNYVFQSNYASGLRVLDITDRTRPREVGFIDTEPAVADDFVFEGSWSNYPYFRSGTVIVSSIGEGLFVVRPRVMTPVP